MKSVIGMSVGGLIGVTTFAVVWIEILILVLGALIILSPPSRWCGLKLGVLDIALQFGAGHHLRGGVD